PTKITICCEQLGTGGITIFQDAILTKQGLKTRLCVGSMSKKAIADYFHNHTEAKHVVLKEMVGRNSYHDQELRRGIDLQENNRGRIIWTDQSEFSVAVWAEESLV
ncbi:MAG: hypothetical protein IJT16_08575, partial [Lachnospiraceae bacterium]|nr:hypothetical protein [Lachnospiraceae bacterium]